ncbi:MAG: transcriptional regulator NrdR [Candidatus Glassbacteria bacterium RBG_16_58_8]|uniref:Transcriptional repressor NrdR n=1 Tax=Candidatus Glassbacteria bacterium RBG_16_58_8 TaxID=1817866 RepID=A0A1F5YBU8_9BACT|nr:MAG: transcriptional regulator NrdR [Candidatus Glassbacteria bacterium RBG_16_58_8]
MKCPFCGHEEDKVVDSRSSREGKAIRRRRECLSCSERFTTYEYVEEIPLMVVKRDGNREPYDRQKLLKGIMTACKKRPVTIQAMEAMVNEIGKEMEDLDRREIKSIEIGEKVMEKLKTIDHIAYVRFASVYRKFKDTTEFLDEVRELLDTARRKPDSRKDPS